MPTEDLMNYLSCNTIHEKTKMQFAFHCAPLLKGLSMANLVMLSAQCSEELERIIQNTDISYYHICSVKERDASFLYRQRELDIYLKKKNIMRFMRRYGYFGDSLEDKLKVLAEHISEFHTMQKEFPHELGVFLGYPIEDVEGFIQNDGKIIWFQGIGRFIKMSKAKKCYFRHSMRPRKQLLGIF